MKLPKLEFADLARAGHVTRWHSVRTTRNQTLAEHLFMVTTISNRLAKDILGLDLDDSGLLRIMEYASLHDAPELLMGDLPSPLKRHIEAISGDSNPILIIEQQIAPWLTEMKNEIQRQNPEHLVIVKLADLIDAILFIEQEGIGLHAQEVCRGLKDIFQKKMERAVSDYPQYSWAVVEALLEKLLHNAVDGQIAFERV